VALRQRRHWRLEIRGHSGATVPTSEWRTRGDERLRFVVKLLDGEAMTEVCREFGISRKTGYKVFRHYQDMGVEALSDRSRRPVRYANQLPTQIESLIVTLKREKPHWDARKIRADVRPPQEH
jgi:transposase